MVAIPRAPRPADLSTRRREFVTALLRRERPRLSRLNPDARILYTVAALVCDDTGYARSEDVENATTDASTVQCARTLLKRAGY